MLKRLLIGTCICLIVWAMPSTTSFAQRQSAPQIWITFSDEPLRGYLLAAVAKFERANGVGNDTIRVSTDTPPDGYKLIFARMGDQNRKRKLIEEERGWMIINLSTKSVGAIQNKLERIFTVDKGKVYIKLTAWDEQAYP